MRKETPIKENWLRGIISKAFLGGTLLTLVMIIYISYMRVDVERVYVSGGMATMLVVFLSGYMYMRKPSFGFTLGSYLGIGAYTVYLSHLYNEYDELEHFFMIDFLHLNHRLPGFYDPVSSERLAGLFPMVEINGNFEAVQTPLSYYLFYVVMLPFKDVAVRFYIARTICFLMGALVLVILKKTVELAKKEGMIEDKGLTDYVIFIVAICPVYLETMCRVSNDALMGLIAAVIIYRLIKYLIDYDNEITKREYFVFTIDEWILLGLSLTLFWVKLSAVLVMGAVAVCLFMHRRFKQTMFFCATMVFGCSPWFLLNYLRYGELTGSQHHLEIINQWINVEGKALSIGDLLQNTATNMKKIFEGRSYYFTGLYTNLPFAAGAVYIVLILALCFALYSTIRIIMRRKTIFGWTSSEILTGLITFMVAGELGLLFIESLSSEFCIVEPRAFLAFIFPILIMVNMLINEFITDSSEGIILAGHSVFSAYLLFAVVFSLLMCYGDIPHRSTPTAISVHRYESPVARIIDMPYVYENGRAIRKKALTGNYMILSWNTDDVSDDGRKPTLTDIYYRDDDWRFERRSIYLGVDMDPSSGKYITYIPEELRTLDSIELRFDNADLIADISVEVAK